MYKPVKPLEPSKTVKVRNFFDVNNQNPAILMDYDESTDFNSLTISIRDLYSIYATIKELPDEAEDVEVVFEIYSTKVYFTKEIENPTYNSEYTKYQKLLAKYQKLLAKYQKDLDNYSKSLPSILEKQKLAKQKKLEKQKLAKQNKLDKEYNATKAKLAKLEKQLGTQK